jgi:multidrug resistance efflux pump
MNTIYIAKFKTIFTKNPKLIFFPALLVGVLILMLSIALKPELSITSGNGAVRSVNVMPLALTNIAPQATGFGQVRPKHQWSAIAEVTGEIISMSAELSKGNFIAAGTQLLQIDPLKYQLALAQAEAELNRYQLQLARLEQEQTNLAKNLAIEESRLVLTKLENKRLTKLKKQGLISQSDLDNQQLQLLTVEKTVQEFSQQLALFDNEKSVAVAQINLATASVAEANRSLENTVIIAPRNIKIAQVDIEPNQVVSINQIMLIGHALEVMEVEAQVSIADMHMLISSIRQDIEPTALTPELLQKISASISLRSGSMQQSWSAQVTRISETIDLNQATVGVILEVSQDLNHLKKGRAPLLNGMFIQATLLGQQTPQFSVPEKALHTNRLYLMDKENKLKIVPVTVLYRNQSHTVIKADITAGDQLILNDLLPAVEGMSLAIKVNKDTAITTVGDDQ